MLLGSKASYTTCASPSEASCATAFPGLPLAKKNQRLVFIQERRTLNGYCLLYPGFIAWREQAKSFAGLAFVALDKSAAQRYSGTRDIYATTITANTFTVLGVTPMLGRDFVPSDELPGSAGGHSELPLLARPPRRHARHYPALKGDARGTTPAATPNPFPGCWLRLKWRLP